MKTQIFLRPNLGLRILLKLDSFKKRIYIFFRFLTPEIFVKFTVDSSRIRELHLQAMCYVYVLRLRNLLLKLPNMCPQSHTARGSLAWLSVCVEPNFAHAVSAMQCRPQFVWF